ncbi:MAG: C69 family dipeptidase [Myxococcota bacterium]|nr:C69 family dipeptidase [Myxococcota bacterium]
MCDCLVASGDQARGGVTVFAKNSDRPEHECQPFVQHAAACHAPGSRVRCTHVEIAQVAETYAVMGHSPWWVWGFEHGVNEHALAIGNLTVFSKEEIEARPGLIGMDLVRLGLERGRNAREALELIAALIETHGQGGSAFAPEAAGYHNAFVLADPHEAWLLQTSNRRWAARRTRRDALSNQLSLRSDWEIGSRDLESFAEAEGWWGGSGRLDVTSAYRNPHVPRRISEPRLRRSLELLERRAGELDAGAMIDMLRDHGEGGAVRRPGSTPDDEAYYTLCMHSEPVGTTTASLVAPLPAPTAGPWPVWISFGTPCTGIFLPVYLDGVIPAELARTDAAAGVAGESLWSAMKALQDAAAADFPRHTPALRDAWKELEARGEAERGEVEADVRRALAARDREAVRRLLTEFMARIWREAAERARELAAGLAAC